MNQSMSHVSLALYQPLIPHVELALCEFFLVTHVAALAATAFSFVSQYIGTASAATKCLVHSMK